MSIPDTGFTIRDGALGTLPQGTGISAAIGVATAGTVNAVVPVSDKQSLVDAFTSGPLVEAVAHTLDAGGGGVVYCVRINASVAGSNSAVTPGTNTGTAILTITGTPLDSYSAIVKITTGGTNLAAATAAFTYSLDNGNNTSAPIAVPVSGVYALPGTGLTLNFANGAGPTSFVVGDSFTFTSTQPGWVAADLTAAYNALVADSRTWSFLHVIGQATNGTGSASIAGSLDSLVQASANAFRFTRAVMQAADDTDANLISAFASFASQYGRVAVAAGFEDLTSTITGRIHKRPASWVAAARLHRIPVQEHPGRVRTGALPGVEKLYRDEQLTPGLDAARFITLRTIVGKQGFFITRGNTMASSGSDFAEIQGGRVMDVACTIVRTNIIEYLNDDLRTTPNSSSAPPLGQPGAPGTILEQEARTIEKDIGGKLRLGLVSQGAASDTTFEVNRTDILATTKNVRTKVRVLPLGYAEALSVDIGFSNPALSID